MSQRSSELPEYRKLRGSMSLVQGMVELKLFVLTVNPNNNLFCLVLSSSEQSINICILCSKANSANRWHKFLLFWYG